MNNIILWLPMISIILGLITMWATSYLYQNKIDSSYEACIALWSWVMFSAIYMIVINLFIY